LCIYSTANTSQDVLGVVVAIALEVARSQQTDVFQLRGAASHQPQSVSEEQQHRMQLSGYDEVPSGCSAASKLATTGRTYADATAAAPKPEANDQTVKTTEPEPDKCSVAGEMVTVIITVHQIMTGLKTEEADDDRFAMKNSKKH
jgi:hypothetical protein